MNYEVYSYWNFEELRGVFNAVAALTNSADFTGLLRLLAMIAIVAIVLAVLAGRARHEDFWRWVIMLAVVNGLMLVPKATVVVVDRVTSKAPAVVANVPIGLAVIAHTTSKIGDWMTRAYETTFALPNDLKMGTNGFLFGHRLLSEQKDITSAKVTSGWMRDFQEFWRECVMPDISNGYIPLDALRTATNLWNVFNNTNPALYVTLSTVGTVNCPSAYNDLGTRLDNQVVSAAIQRMASEKFPNDASNVTKIKNSLAATYSHGLNIPGTAESIVKQAMLVNDSIRAYCGTFAQLGDSQGSSLCYASSTGAYQTNFTYQVLAKIAESSMPKLKSAIEIIQYAVFPFVLAFAIVAAHLSLPVLKTYTMSLIWVQLWAPLYAVVHYIQTVKMPEYAGTLGSLAGTIGGSADQFNMAVSDQAVAGMLVVAIPPIAAALVKGGEVGLQAVAGLVSAPRTAERQAAATAMGNEAVGQWNAAANVIQGEMTQRYVNRQGTSSWTGNVFTFEGSWGKLAGIDANNDSKASISEVLSVVAPGFSMAGSTAGTNLGTARSSGTYSDSGVTAKSGTEASLGDTRSARLTDDQAAEFSRGFGQALQRIIGGGTSWNIGKNAGKTTSHNVSAEGNKELSNTEGGGFTSSAGTSAGEGRPGYSLDPENQKTKSGRSLAYLNKGINASVRGDVRTAQQYLEAAKDAIRGMSTEEIKDVFGRIRTALDEVRGNTTDEGVRKAAERLSAAFDKTKTFDEKQVAGLIDQITAGERKEATEKASGDVSVDRTKELLMAAWNRLASQNGWDDTVSNERLNILFSEWNNNATLREQAELDVANNLRSTTATKIEAPLTRGDVTSQGSGLLQKLRNKGVSAVTNADRQNKSVVKAQQPADPRSMPNLEEAKKAQQETAGRAEFNLNSGEGSVFLNAGINAIASRIYQDRQKGFGTTLFNSLGFGAFSANVEQYAMELRNAAASDQNLARSLTDFGRVMHNAQKLPENERANEIFRMAELQLRSAEGKASMFWMAVRDTYNPSNIYNKASAALGDAWAYGEQTVSQTYGMVQRGPEPR